MKEKSIEKSKKLKINILSQENFLIYKSSEIPEGQLEGKLEEIS